MNLGFDLDGVLYPWHEKVWSELNISGLIESTFNEFWDKEWLIMREEKSILFMNFVNDPLMYSCMSPYYGARSLLKTLKESGHTIWYVTQRSKHLDFTTRQWVRHWKLPFEDNVVRVEGSKRLTIIEKEIDFFVDDAIRHAQDLKDFTKVILINRPYNKEIQKDFDSVDSVLQVGKYINGKE